MSTPFEKLRQVFHEPSRLAILSVLVGLSEPIRFGELKDRCRLTDGNLSRHLRALEELKTVRIRKSFVDSKPRTTVVLTASGRESFLNYLESLEAALRAARRAERGLSHGTEPEPA